MEVLQQHVSSLETELQEKDRDLVMAAQFGKKLLDTNQELQYRLEEITKEYSEKIEALEQEKYSLQLKVDCHKANFQSLQQELENSRSQLEEEHDRRVRRTEEMCSKKVHDATSLNEDLKMEVHKLEVQVKNYQEKLKKQEEMVEQLNEEVSNKGNTTVLQHELRDLEMECVQEKAMREELEMRVMDAEACNEVLQVENSSLCQRVESLEEECEERSRQANSWYEALREAKEEVVELNGRIEMMKVGMNDEFHQKSGNSLFGEVDDRRLDIERKMITLQVNYDTLEKSHATTKQHYKKLKAEMSALFCQYGATMADAAHVQRLQRALEQSKSETQVLLTKVHKLEKQQADMVSGHEKQRCMAAFTDFGDKKEYIQFLERGLEQAKSEKVSTLQELDMKRTQLLWETNKLSDTEARLHHSEQEQAKMRKEITKLRLRLQETMERVTEAQGACQVLEGEMALLEEQLKSRGKRGTDRAKMSSQAGSRRSSIQGKNSLLHVTASGENLSSELATRQGSEPPSAKSVEKEGDVQKENVAPAPHPRTKKEINLLEELEVELNKQKREELIGDQKFRTSSPPKAGSHASSSSLKLHTDTTSENSGLSERPIDSIVPGVPLTAGKVIHVNSKASVNQCPQQ